MLLKTGKESRYRTLNRSQSDKQQTVLAIDPGMTTGLALVSFQGVLLHVTTDNFKTFEGVAHYILDNTIDVVVIEDFIGAGPRTKEAIFVLKLIGKIEGVCYTQGIPVVMQNPQVRKPYMLMVRNNLKKAISKHEEDAYAHALAYLNRREKQ